MFVEVNVLDLDFSSGRGTAQVYEERQLVVIRWMYWKSS